MILHDPGDVIECQRAHFTFRRDGEIVQLDEGELLIVVEMDYFQGLALRCETSELVSISTLEIPSPDFTSNHPTYIRVWP